MLKRDAYPEDIGLYHREYDDFSENNNSEEMDAIADVLEWMEENTPIREKTKKERTDKVKELIAAGIALEGGNKEEAIAAMKRITQGGIIGGIKGLWSDLKYALKDLFAGRRLKSSATTIASISVGIAIGAILGTLVFPGIGTAAGGLVGAIFEVAGGAIGMSVFGGLLGSWSGVKLSKWLFKNEMRELSKHSTDKLKKRFGIDPDIALSMNAYLYNREQAVQSPLLKRYYKMIRTTGLLDLEPVGIEKISRFFCKELSMLSDEKDFKGDNPILQKEIGAVHKILVHLKNAKGLSYQSRDRIGEELNIYKFKPPRKQLAPDLGLDDVNVEIPPSYAQDKPKIPPSQDLSMTFSGSAPTISKPKIGFTFQNPQILRKQFDEIKSRFMKNLRQPEFNVKKVKVVDINNFDSDQLTYRYKITQHNESVLPDIVYREKTLSHGKHITELTVDRSQLTQENQETIINILVEHAKAYYEITQNKNITVLAGGDDMLAINLMAAALKAGLEPKLHFAEYSENNPAQRKNREEIIQRAQELANKPRRKPKKPSPFMEPRW